MRHRPKRENYPNGTYGEMDYQEYLERYCTYLENKNKALTKQCNIADVVGRGTSNQFMCDKCDDQKYVEVIDLDGVITVRKCPFCA
jgi:hypothetical protein